MDFFICSSANGCLLPSEADANTDTVKVNPQLELNKENAPSNCKERELAAEGKSPKFDAAAAAAAEKATVEMRIRLRAAVERAEREAAEDAQKLAAELAADEVQVKEAAKIERQDRRIFHERQLYQEAAARVAANVAAEWHRQEEKLKAIGEQQLKDQAEREEQERQEEVERLRKETELAGLRLEAEQKALDSKKVEDFLSEHGYSGVSAKRTRMLKSKYPLHTAVKFASKEVVVLLLAAGADPTVKNSAGDTPKQLACKLSKTKGGTHGAVYEVLQ